VEEGSCRWGPPGPPDAFLSRWANGATTFWEAYDPTQSGEACRAFYRRPFGKSLCHAWGAGPAAIPPAEILGVRPTEDGWAELTVEPRPGPLAWVTATVPRPTGRIEIEVRGGQLTVVVPRGSRLRWRDETHGGPTTLRRASPEPARAASCPRKSAW
jgi:alpha-L-rhamnosidase